MNEDRDNAHKLIEKAFAEAGIVDGFYCGVLLTGKDVSSYVCGTKKLEYSNIERYQRLLGIVEDLKTAMIHAAIENSRRIKEEENNGNINEEPFTEE